MIELLTVEMAKRLRPGSVFRIGYNCFNRGQFLYEHHSVIYKGIYPIYSENGDNQVKIEAGGGKFYDTLQLGNLIGFNDFEVRLLGKICPLDDNLDLNKPFKRNFSGYCTHLYECETRLENPDGSFQNAICRGSGAEACWLLDDGDTLDDLDDISGW